MGVVDIILVLVFPFIELQTEVVFDIIVNFELSIFVVKLKIFFSQEKISFAGAQENIL